MPTTSIDVGDAVVVEDPAADRRRDRPRRVELLDLGLHRPRDRSRRPGVPWIDSSLQIDQRMTLG